MKPGCLFECAYCLGPRFADLLLSRSVELRVWGQRRCFWPVSCGEASGRAVRNTPAEG